MPRLFVSAAHKSSGKTTISLGISSALTARGLIVQTFKKGPDYIDPMWHTRASGRPCYNLDFNTQSTEEIIGLAARKSAGADFCLIEGNKGLHDGVDPEGGDSSAAMAKLLKSPVILVIDVLGMTRGIAPLLMGYSAFDRDVQIAGVIFNRVGTPRQESKLRAAVERYCDIPILGAIGRERRFHVAERHLGLTTPAEDDAWARKISLAAQAVRDGIDLDALVAIARQHGVTPLPAPVALSAKQQTITIAIARDEAFGFYYADDLEALERCGAKLVFFDAFRDRQLPACDALVIGGGFPELHAASLAANHELRKDIADKIRRGLPAYAECGGLMYLSQSIEMRGHEHEMAGVLPGKALFHEKPQGRGLVTLAPRQDHPWKLTSVSSGGIRAHEFHYASLEEAGDARFAYDVMRGHGIDGAHDGIQVYNLLANFTHLRDTAQCRWTEHFVEFVKGKLQMRAA